MKSKDKYKANINRKKQLAALDEMKNYFMIFLKKVFKKHKL